MYGDVKRIYKHCSCQQNLSDMILRSQKKKHSGNDKSFTQQFVGVSFLSKSMSEGVSTETQPVQKWRGKNLHFDDSQVTSILPYLYIT
jgi:hypothetical protein